MMSKLFTDPVADVSNSSATLRCQQQVLLFHRKKPKKHLSNRAHGTHFISLPQNITRPLTLSFFFFRDQQTTQSRPSAVPSFVHGLIQRIGTYSLPLPCSANLSHAQPMQSLCENSNGLSTINEEWEYSQRAGAGRLKMRIFGMSCSGSFIFSCRRCYKELNDVIVDFTTLISSKSLRNVFPRMG